jgi:hypothetical protein
MRQADLGKWLNWQRNRRGIPLAILQRRSATALDEEGAT